MLPKAGATPTIHIRKTFWRCYCSCTNVSSVSFCLRFAIGYDLDLDLNLSFAREGDEAKEDSQGTGDKTQQKSNHIMFISCIHFECFVKNIYIGKYHIF